MEIKKIDMDLNLEPSDFEIEDLDLAEDAVENDPTQMIGASCTTCVCTCSCCTSA